MLSHAKNDNSVSLVVIGDRAEITCRINVHNGHPESTDFGEVSLCDDA